MVGVELKHEYELIRLLCRDGRNECSTSVIRGYAYCISQLLSLETPMTTDAFSSLENCVLCSCPDNRFLFGNGVQQGIVQPRELPTSARIHVINVHLRLRFLIKLQTKSRRTHSLALH